MPKPLRKLVESIQDSPTIDESFPAIFRQTEPLLHTSSGAINKVYIKAAVEAYNEIPPKLTRFKQLYERISR